MVRLLLQLVDVCKHLDAFDRSDVARGSRGAMQRTSLDSTSLAGACVAQDFSAGAPQIKVKLAIVEFVEGAADPAGPATMTTASRANWDQVNYRYSEVDVLRFNA